MVRTVCRVAIPFGLALSLACGGGSSNNNGGNPNSPSTPSHPPSITGMTVSPSFGISQLTQFAMSGTATDAGNDITGWAWDFGDGSTGGGQSTQKTYNGSGAMNVKLIVTDSKGSTTNDSRSVNVGSMTGNWKLTTTACSGWANQTFTMSLTQTGTTVSGTFSMPDGFCAAPKGSTGRTDPAEPGTIAANGAVNIRFKVGAFMDFYFRGTMQSPGNRVTGGVFNSGFAGENSTLDKQ